MKTILNLLGKVKRLPELFREFLAADRESRLADLEHQRATVRECIAKWQAHEREIERQIRQEKGMETLGVGS